MANTYLTKTFSGSPTSNQKGTVSYWFKRSKIGVAQQIGLKTAASAGAAGSYFGANDRCYFYYEIDGAWDVLQTTRVFRDTSAWYHMVFNWDSTLATSGDRLQIWVNGVRETDFADEVQPALNETNNIGAAQAHYINTFGSADYFDGLMSHFHYIDGIAYPASTFGSTDATTGEWKINTSPTITMGNNGFTILKDGNTITDQSTNSNDWTLGGGTLTNTEDCPSDVFATLNPLANYSYPPTLSIGNTKATGAASQWQLSRGSLGFSKGKFYWEVKISGSNVGSNHVGVVDETASNYAGTHGQAGTITLYNGDGGEIFTGSDGAFTSANYGDMNGSTDILGVACNFDDGQISYYKNGSIIVTNNALDSVTNNKNTLFPLCVMYGSGNIQEYNFGNGYFGTTAITSEGTNASNIGKFEYDVPTGYTALSTKGLNS